MTKEIAEVIANTILVIFILFCLWLIICSIVYRDKRSVDLSGQQSERQEKNDDYNMDYYP